MPFAMHMHPFHHPMRVLTKRKETVIQHLACRNGQKLIDNIYKKSVNAWIYPEKIKPMKSERLVEPRKSPYKYQ